MDFSCSNSDFWCLKGNTKCLNALADVRLRVGFERMLFENRQTWVIWLVLLETKHLVLRSGLWKPLCLIIYLPVNIAAQDLRNMLGERQPGFTFLEVSHGRKSQLGDQSISQACFVSFANSQAYSGPGGSNVKTGLDPGAVLWHVCISWFRDTSLHLLQHDMFLWILHSCLLGAGHEFPCAV